MWMYKMTSSIRKRTNFRKFLSRKPNVPNFSVLTAKENERFLENKKVIISGEFFPDSENALKQNLLERKAHVQCQMSPETELLICGKYPDWKLIEKAKTNGLKILFVDKSSDLFPGFCADRPDSIPAAFHQVPLGI